MSQNNTYLNIILNIKQTNTKLQNDLENSA